MSVVERNVARVRTDKLALLVRAGEIFHQSLEIEETLYNVARLAVESFADLCLFDLLDERSERLYVTAGAHRDPSMERLIKKVEGLLYNAEFRLHPVLRVTQTGEPFFIPVIDEKAIEAHAASRQHAEYMRELGYKSKIVVPVTAQGQIFGALTFVLTRENANFDSADVEFAIDLGRRAGLAIANAKQYHREQYVAATLQRAFLTRDFPNCENLRFSALYRPGLSDAELGGDWYDAFKLRNGKILMTIGDVTGKGLEAARLMVQIRQAIRIGSIRFDDPAEILKLVNEVLLLDPSAQLATAFVALLDPDTFELVYASAGHVPPFCRLADGTIEELLEPAPPLGISMDIEIQSNHRHMADGSMLVMYTDGVTEICRDAVRGEEMLKDVLRGDSILRSADPARFVERAISGNVPRDDIAILVARFGCSEPKWRFDGGDPRAAFAVKSEFLHAVEEVSGVAARDLNSCELIFAELIGNCVRHAGGPLSISLEVSDRIRLHVIDEGPGFDYDPKLPIDIWAESGRGLFLISQLADGVTVRRLPGCGSHISVDLPVDIAAS